MLRAISFAEWGTPCSWIFIRTQLNLRRPSTRCCQILHSEIYGATFRIWFKWDWPKSSGVATYNQTSANEKRRYVITSDFRQYIAGYIDTVANLWRHPIRRGVIWASALELNILICIIAPRGHLFHMFITIKSVSLKYYSHMNFTTHFLSALPSTTKSTSSTSTVTTKTTTTTATTAPTTTTSTPATTTSTFTMPPTTSQPTICPEYFGYFVAIAKNKRPVITSTLASAIRKSSKQCAQFCLVEQGCLSFTYTHLTALCVLFDQIYNINLEINVGTHYYKRRDLC